MKQLKSIPIIPNSVFSFDPFSPGKILRDDGKGNLINEDGEIRGFLNYKKGSIKWIAKFLSK